MKRVLWTDSAIADLDEIKAYLSEFSPALAQHTLNSLILAARWLLDYPKAGSPLENGRWRKWRPRKTRHILIYECTNGGISVLRVRHERNDWRPVPE